MNAPSRPRERGSVTSEIITLLTITAAVGLLVRCIRLMRAEDFEVAMTGLPALIVGVSLLYLARWTRPPFICWASPPAWSWASSQAGTEGRDG